VLATPSHAHKENLKHIRHCCRTYGLPMNLKPRPEGHTNLTFASVTLASETGAIDLGAATQPAKQCQSHCLQSKSMQQRYCRTEILAQPPEAASAWISVSNFLLSVPAQVMPYPVNHATGISTPKTLQRYNLFPSCLQLQSPPCTTV